METVHGKNIVKLAHVENGKANDRAIIEELQHPPPRPLLSRSGDLDLGSSPQMLKCSKKANAATVAAARATDVIIPDPTPKGVNSAFYDACLLVFPFLKQDSVPRFLRFFKEDGRGFYAAHEFITPESFNHMIIKNALRCAKVALEGQAPELRGCRANPNCMNQYGYFPLHQAAEKFSVDMIKLLLEHGALTNLRTAGSKVVEGLLPLHVAVENTCMHKYLEENLFPNVDHPDYPSKVDDNYIFKLIHLLCLPEMKVFLDTTRVLAENTDDLLDEIWNYVMDGKVVQTAVLLMAAQKHIRGGYSCKTNGEIMVDGFTVIIKRIHHFMMFPNKEKLQQGNSKIKTMLSTLLLVNIISLASEAIDSALRARSTSKMSHLEILERVSSILKDRGFTPTGENVNIENLRPYKIPMPNGEVFNEKVNLVAAKTTANDSDQFIAGKKVVTKRLSKGWKHRYTWLRFFPYWRSVLSSKFPVKVYPGYAEDDIKFVRGLGHIDKTKMNSSDKVSIPGHNLALLQRNSQPPRFYQPSRGFSTALTILKFLKKA